MISLEPTAWLVIIAAIAVGIVLLAALARRLGWTPSLRQAWRDVWACLVEAGRMLSTRTRLLWVAAILMAWFVASWVGWTALVARQFGGSYWEVLAARMRVYRAEDISTLLADLVSRLKFQPGQVAHYFWPSPGGRTLVELFAVIVVLVALLLTVRSWGQAARSQGAAASAWLLRWLLGPALLISGLVAYLLIWPPWDFSLPGRRSIGEAIVIPVMIPVALWFAGVAGAVLTAVRRGIAGHDPWSPRELGWGALRHLRALFLLALYLSVAQSLAFVAPDSWAYRQSARQLMGLLTSWAMVALLLAPAVIVSETTGALDGVRLALRAWLRAPLHLVLAIVLGMAALWVASLLKWLIVQAVAGPVAVGIPLKVAGLAVSALVTIWAAAVALLLWQRLRDRVVSPAPAGSG